jgi:glycosyltransferase involved in cell wall biosynthesis
MVHISAVLMVKNEHNRIRVTLDSMVRVIDSLVVLDTGSTDNTVDIIYTFGSEHKIPIRLIRYEFVDFSTSRNVVLEFADKFEDIDFLLLMDCNDELRGGEELREFAAKADSDAWLVNQEWYSGVCQTYYNIRFIRPRRNWRYKGVVHEYIQNIDQPDIIVSERIPSPVCIYQDRTKDDDTSEQRFPRDRELLLKQHQLDPTDSRTIFYLAQTCSCLGLNEEAYKYYEMRSKMVGFYEEVFHSYLKLGELSCKDWDIAMKWYIKALEHSCRVEPLICIAEHYRSTGKWLLSFHFARMACELEYPVDAALYVDRFAYTYTRYHLMGIVGYYCGHFQEGQQACMLAVEAEGRHVDINNLKFYENIFKIPKYLYN